MIIVGRSRRYICGRHRELEIVGDAWNWITDRSAGNLPARKTSRASVTAYAPAIRSIGLGYLACTCMWIVGPITIRYRTYPSLINLNGRVIEEIYTATAAGCESGTLETGGVHVDESM